MFSISVVIPTFNGLTRGYIFEAINSVLAQTVLPTEIIVVDDGSSDGTADAVKRTFPQVTVLSKSNGGLSSARNYGIEHARSELIAILDDDDLWLPQKLEQQLQLLTTRPELDLLCCGLIRFLNDGRSIGVGSPALERLTYPEILLGGNPITGPSGVVFKRTLWARLNGFDESLRAVEDYDFWIRASRVGHLGGTREHLVKYRIHSTQMSSSQIEMGKKVLDVLGKNGRGLSNTCLKRVFFYYVFTALSGSLARRKAEDILFWTQLTIRTFNLPVAMLRTVSLVLRFNRTLQSNWRKLEIRYIFSNQVPVSTENA